MTAANLPDLDAIQARADAATEGPWANYGDLAHEVYPVRTGDNDEPENIASVVPGLADAHFIAAARTDVPALLALVRSQQAQIERDVEAAIEAGLATHDWEMFEAQNGDIAEAVVEAIRAALTATEGAA